jgi:PAS domain S-box-containing protein
MKSPGETTSEQPAMVEDRTVSYRSEAPPARAAHPKRVALLTALVYVAAGLTWIAGSDWALRSLIRSTGDPLNLITYFQTMKGWAYVLVTGLLLYFLVLRYLRSLQASQKEMQQRLEGIAQQYRMLFEQSPVAMLIFDPLDQRILAANEVCHELFGYTRAQLLTMRTLDLLVEQERERAISLSRSRLPAVSRQPAWQNRRQDGRIIFLDSISHAIEFNGQVARIVLLTDVTERLQAERSLAQYRQELEQRVTDRTAELSTTNRKLREEVQERHRIESDLRAATAAAEAANAAKSTFLANTSHEIRTPLTSILGYADLLSDPALAAPERARYLDVLQKNAQHLLALIDDLLDLSRAEMGKARVSFDDHSPREAAEQAIELLRPRAREKSLELTLDFVGDLPDTVHTDGIRLRQVLLNLLSNALKFTHAGRVSLTVSTVTHGSVPYIRFEVSDTGIGIADEHVSHIFDPFYQVDQGASRRYGGTGLGLTISRQLTAQMGGTLTVQSRTGIGSVFILELPMESRKLAESALETDTAALRLDGTVLLAEDNANIRLLVEEYLRRAGMKVVPAADGAQAVEIIKESLSGVRPAIDLVLLDLYMPVIDGAQAMREMRGVGYGGPVVGLTADYAAKSPAEWSSAGWDAMAAKPIDRRAFIPLLARMLARREAGVIETRQNADGPGVARTV